MTATQENPSPTQTMTHDEIKNALRPYLQDIMKMDQDVLQVELVPNYAQRTDGILSLLEPTGVQTLKVTWGRLPRPTREPLDEPGIQ